MNYLREICKNCGYTFGSHYGGVQPWPRNYCPGHEGRMDWDKGPGTMFESTGIYKKDLAQSAEKEKE
jgi:hypothetical protein